MNEERKRELITLKATYSSVLFVSCREQELCFFNSTARIKNADQNREQSTKTEI